MVELVLLLPSPWFFQASKIFSSSLLSVLYFNCKLHRITVWHIISLIKKLTIWVRRLVSLLPLPSLPVALSVSIFYPFLRFLYLVCSVYVSYALISCQLVYIFRDLLRLRLLCLDELSTCLHLSWLAPSMFAALWWVVFPFASSVTCSICVCYPFYLHLLYLGELSTLFASAVYAFSILSSTLLAWSISTMPQWIICSVCVFYGSLCLHLLSVSYPLYLRLLYLSKLSALFVLFVACSVCVCYLCFICFVCICCSLLSYLLHLRLL